MQPFLALGARLAPPREKMPPSLLHFSHDGAEIESHIASRQRALIDQKAIVILYVYFGEWNNGPLRRTCITI